MKKKWLIPLGIVVILILAALVYTRPMTLEELGKVDLAQCCSISGYYGRFPDVANSKFEFSAEDERCSQLIALFAQQKFQRPLSSLLQGDSLRRQQLQDGELIGEVDFGFYWPDFPNSSTTVSAPIRCWNFYGILGVSDTICCTMSNQEAFLQQVYDILSAGP